MFQVQIVSNGSFLLINFASQNVDETSSESYIKAMSFVPRLPRVTKLITFATHHLMKIIIIIIISLTRKSCA